MSLVELYERFGEIYCFHLQGMEKYERYEGVWHIRK
jgi:hypothetical protein